MIKETYVMTAPKSVDPAGFLREQLESASPDLLRDMVKTFAEALMSAEADVVCGAPYGMRSDERTNSRNGYRARDWDTRAGTVELAIPKLRTGSYFPDWLLAHRRRAEQALVSVVATSYLLGVSTRRVEKLVEQLGVAQLSKSQVSEMAAHLDAQVEAFRNRPLDAGPYTFVWCDALTIKVREGGRTVNVHGLVAVGVNADGGREVLGVDVAASEDGAGWLAFLRSLTARGLSGVRLVVSDAHRGLVDAIGATLPGASWQRCRTHYLRNLLTKVPKSAQPWVATMVRTIFDQPDATSVREQFGRVVDTIAARFPDAATSSRSPVSRTRSGARSGPTTHKNASTKRSAAAPTSSGSSRTARRSSAWSALYWPNRPTSGPSNAATWAWKSSARHDSPSWPPTPTRPPQPS
jgi:putative transposase